MCVSISNTKERSKKCQKNHTVAEPLEEQVETSGALVTEAKTRSTVSTTGTVVDVVLEETLAAWMNNVSQNSTSSRLSSIDQP